MKTKKKKNSNVVIAIAILMLGIGIVTVMAIMNNEKTPEDVDIDAAIEEEIRGLYPDNIYDELYSNLPSKSDSFVMIKRDVEKGEIVDLCKIDSLDWKHPDFYPTWEAGKPMHYDNHDYSRWGVHGYGAYPANTGMTIRNLKEGSVLTLCTFFKTSYGVETYQGVYVNPIENEYFKVEISPQPYAEYPNHFLIEPTFPQFEEGWVERISLKITALKDVPVGTYELGFNVEVPDTRFDDEMIWEILMTDTDKDIEYVKKCIESLAERDSDSLSSRNTKTECSKFMLERQKKYIPGGSFQIGRNTYNVKIEVVE